MIYMLLGTGFEETEAIAPLDLLRRAGVEVATVGLNGKIVYGSHKIGVEADLALDQLDTETLEMIILPGGTGRCCLHQGLPGCPGGGPVCL